MKNLTVFTPTYNRAYCLDRLYKSLCEQTCKNFIWLVIDDGSIDNTQQLVESWIKENKVEIRYFYKKNGGMHTAHNLAYQLIETEINTCIDSDDYMPLDAVASIIECWNSVKDDHAIAGIVGLDEDTEGKLIGTYLPNDGTRSALGSFYNKYKVKGDKKLVYRSSITKVYPAYPEYPDERLVPLGYLYTLIDRDYDLVCFNKIWVIVDYQLDGSSNTIYKQYFQSPKGFRDARIANIKYGSGLFFRLKNIIHLGTSNIILKKYNFFIYSPTPFFSFLLFPFSFILFYFLIRKIKKSHNGMEKIIHLIPLDGLGGVETAARSMLSNDLNENNFKLVLIAGKTISNHKLQVIESPFYSPNNPLAHLYVLYKVLHEKPNVLICSLWRTIPVGLLAKLLMPKTRLVYFLHTVSITHIFDKIFNQLMLMFCNAVWSDSNATLAARLNLHKITTTRVISFVTFKVTVTKKSNVILARFVFWGRLDKNKGLDRAINLIKILIDKGCNCNFEIWGPDGGELNNLIEQVKLLQLDKYIQFMGSANHSQLSEISQSNSFYLQLSRLEGMAMSVVEAMQYGLVPIVTPVGEIDNYCKNDINSIVVYDTDNLNETAEKIIYLLDNKEKYNEMLFSAQKTWADALIYRDDFLLAASELLLPQKSL